jgi:hypothetical protein
MTVITFLNWIKVVSQLLEDWISGGKTVFSWTEFYYRHSRYGNGLRWYAVFMTLGLRGFSAFMETVFSWYDSLYTGLGMAGLGWAGWGGQRSRVALAT